ncbi:MAG: hypothetical protein AB1611_03590 [bacterium]
MKTLIVSTIVPFLLIIGARSATCGQALNTRHLAVTGTVRPMLAAHLTQDTLQLDTVISPGVYTSTIPIILSGETNNPPLTISFRSETPDGNLSSEAADYLPTFYAIAPSGSPPPDIQGPRRRWMSGKNLCSSVEEIQSKTCEMNIYVKAYRPSGKQPSMRKKKYSTRIIATVSDKNSNNISSMEFTLWTEAAN